MPESVQTPTESESEATDSSQIALYHHVKETEGAVKSINTVWSLLQNAFEEFDTPNILLAIDITGHRDEDGHLDHEMAVFINEFVIPVGLTVVTELSVDGTHISEDDPETDELGIASQLSTTEAVAASIDLKEMGTEEFVLNHTPLSRYDGNLVFSLIHEQQYSDTDLTDAELLDEIEAQTMRAAE